MDITGVSVEDYKPFKKLHTREIRPLTILIGKNSSGKSALARLPLLLGHSLSERAEAPLDLAFDDLDFAGSFRDLVHGRVPHRSIGIGAGFSNGDGSVEIFAHVQHIDEYKLQVVSEFELKRSDGFTLKMNWQQADPLPDERVYSCTGAYAGEAKARFLGLLPETFVPANGMAGKVVDTVFALRDQLRRPGHSITHLGPFREPPARSYRFPGQMPRGVGMVTGHRAPEVLGADYKTKRGILPKVADWFRDHLGGWEIDIDEVGDGFQVVLKKPGESDSPRVNLVDVGQGMSQVLPLVVQRKYDEIMVPGVG